MRFAFHLLVMLCLVWCAVGVAEPAEAHRDTLPRYELVGGDGDGPVPVKDIGTAELSDHHHCPVAPDLRLPSAKAPISAVGGPLFASAIVALTSLTHAPPLHPPAA